MLCPRLARFLSVTAHENPDYHCKPVPPFGEAAPRLLIVGLAPGMHGANRTGRPFTGDYAGILLYESLYALGLSSAPKSVDRSDGLTLRGVRITNAVKCLPPANKPLPVEIKTCNRYLAAELANLRSVTTILALGTVAHDAVLVALGQKRSAAKFGHGNEHALPENRHMIDSYHCSRYNTQTRRLTTEMFLTVLKRAATLAGLPVAV
ncbi:MAG TPA: uracil-DNA glycosylase [Steroidobacteraceae bacterium]|nr:uracil-DNA glycosylase [Steroidobacteraceae bacterium]